MTESQTRNITPQQARDWLASGEAILIDVREADEFRAGHIPYALSMPLSGVCANFRQLKLPQDKKIIFQCLRGKRGEQACAGVCAQGSGHAVYNIEGGIEGWKAAGLDVIGAGEPGISIFRQVQIVVGLLVLAFTLIGFAGQAWAFAVAGIIGAALAFAGLSGWCGLAMLLARAPWNKTP